MKRTTPKSVLEVVIHLEKGPDEQRRYLFTMYWLATYSPGQAKSKRADGLFVRSQCFNADPLTQIVGRRGAAVRIIDDTETWNKKK